MIIFAGKAHPADVPGQDLIRRISEVARMPEFEGQILLVEDYDLRLARRLVAGVDVWLNSPVYPLEASGTSGMKAGINGTLNLSVLDGWWGEGYNGKNGWAIKPGLENMASAQRDKEESKEFYETLQDHIVPLYYARDKLGYSPGWVKMAKNSMMSLLPRYNAARMVGEYAAKFYVSASRQGTRYADNDFNGAKQVAAWKAYVRKVWGGVAIRRLDTPLKRISFGEGLKLQVAAKLNGLAARGRGGGTLDLPKDKNRHSYASSSIFASGSRASQQSDEHLFALDLTPDLCGKLDYYIRLYPYQPLLTHPFEMGMMIWL